MFVINRELESGQYSIAVGFALTAEDAQAFIESKEAQLRELNELDENNEDPMVLRIRECNQDWVKARNQAYDAISW